jgi:NADH dehydrogenase
MKIDRVCILGGSGFVGHHLGARLTGAGLRCRFVSRRPHRHRDLRVLPGAEVVGGDLFDRDQLPRLLADCQAVINLVGILNDPDRQGQGFRRVHVELVDRIAEAGRIAGVQRFLHMSALNASAGNGTSEYLRSKGDGENQAHTRGHASMRVTSFRPSVIFGPGDGLFGRFATLLRAAPGVFPLACPDARLQPVYVGDVAEAFANALEDGATWERHYDLCGPRAYTLRELVEYTARIIGRKVRVVGLNDTLSRLQARVMERLPGRPFTMDNYLSLQLDSVCSDSGLAKLGIEPRAVEDIVPLYLGPVSQRRRYSQLRRLG